MVKHDWPNLVTMFFDQADRMGERPFLWRRRSGDFVPLTWREVAAQVSALARGLKTMGVGTGDRVTLVSENRPEWLIADIAVMAVGGITVPAYTTNTVEDHLYILENSGSKGVIVSTRRLAERVLAAAAKSAETAFVLTMDEFDTAACWTVPVTTWKQAIAMGDRDHTNLIEAAAQLERNQTACIIYTSGTGGAPKGVMLHHGAILHNLRGALDFVESLGLKDEVFLSFLPLSHAYEHTAGQFFSISLGAEIYYAEGPETLASDLIAVRPTIMTAVPRLYEMLHQRIIRDVRRKGGLTEKLFIRTIELGRLRADPARRLNPLQWLADRVLDRLVRDKVRARFGGRIKAMISGGAPLNPEIGTFFTALGVPIFQGYGQTEAAPLICVNRPQRVRMETVGPPVKDVELRIAEDGEVLVRGELVMQGYWRNEEATRNTIVDGWLHTGDIGELDADGYLRITDRKKDLIVNSGGDNLSPARIEGMLTLQREIAQAMVYGDSRPHVVALLVPDAEWMATWAGTREKSPDLRTLADDADFRAAIGEVVDRVNLRLSVIERIRRVKIADEPFSVENGQLTPTMKIRRHVIRQRYGRDLEALYG